MDLWDLTKLLFRRWYAFVPLLLVSATVVLLVSQSVKPDYSAVGHLQLIPPAISDNKDVKTPNPWAELGLQALGNAVILKVQDENTRHSLVSTGYSDNFSITIEYNTTYFSIEAIGTTRAQATGTVQEIMRLLTAEVKSQQTRFGAGDRDSFTTLQLDAGDKVTVVTTKKTRLLVVAGGVAILFSVAMTVGLDALLRRRARRRPKSEVDGVSIALPVVAKARLDAAVGRRRTNGAAEDAVSETMVLSTARDTVVLPAVRDPVSGARESASADSQPVSSNGEAAATGRGRVSLAKVAAPLRSRLDNVYRSESYRPDAVAVGDDEPDAAGVRLDPTGGLPTAGVDAGNPEAAGGAVAGPGAGPLASTAKAGHPPVTMKFRQSDSGTDAVAGTDDAAGSGAPADDDGADGDRAEPPVELSDATIVLPLSPGPWAGREDQSRGR